MPSLPRPTVKNITSMLHMDALAATAVLDALLAAEASSDVHDVDRALEVAEAGMRKRQRGGTFGIEPLRDPDGGLDRYWGDVVALYVNTGDTYSTTIVYDVERDKFYVTSWGDWVEAWERRHRRQLA
jgi:hypothetical protein